MLPLRKQLPAATFCGEEMKTNLVGPDAEMVSVCVAALSNIGSAVRSAGRAAPARVSLEYMSTLHIPAGMAATLPGPVHPLPVKKLAPDHDDETVTAAPPATVAALPYGSCACAVTTRLHWPAVTVRAPLE